MDGHTDHRFVRGQFRQRAGIDAIDFKEVSGGLHASTFIAVKVGLAFSYMEGLRGGDFVEVAGPVKIDVLRLCYGRLQRILATQPVQASPGFNLIPVNRVDLFSCQKVGFLFQGNRCRELAYSARRRNRPACNVLVFRCASPNR